MNQPLNRWSRDAVARHAIAATPGAAGRTITIHDSSLQHGATPEFTDRPSCIDAGVNRVFSVRSYGSTDLRLFEAAREAHLFSPGPDALHAPTYMPDVLVQYRNNVMVAGDVMPVVPVQDRSDYVAQVPIGTGLKPADVSLAGQASQLPELLWNVSRVGTYLVVDRGLRTFIPGQSMRKADAPFEVRMTTARILADVLDLVQEISVAGIVFTAANYASGYSTTVSSASDKWDNPASDPLQQVRIGRKKLLVGNGVKVKLVLGYDVFIALQSHPKILASFLSRPIIGNLTGAPFATKQMMAAIFNVDEVIVGEAKYNSANDGATVSLSDVWAGHAALITVVERPSRTNPAGFGYQFRLDGVAMKTQFIPDQVPGIEGGEHCKVTHSTDEFVTSNAGGYLWRSVLSS